MLSSSARLIAFASPILFLSRRQHLRIEQVWYLSVASTILQAMLSHLLLRSEFRRRLVKAVAADPALSMRSA